MDKTGNNSGGALAYTHPHYLFNHSRWYFTSDYSVNTTINSNPTGKVLISASRNTDILIVLLYDYDPLTGSKTLIGSNLSITLIGGTANRTYSYTIISPTYIVPQNHRLMLQFDFNQGNQGTSNARVYANQSNSYLTVVETPITYDVTINSKPSYANVSAGANVTYNRSL